MHLLNQSFHRTNNEQIVWVTYQIAGFDRVNFVSDITNTVLQDESFLIRALSFEADGIRATGVLTIQIQHGMQPVNTLTQRLRSVQGVVSLRESHEQLP